MTRSQTKIVADVALSGDAGGSERAYVFSGVWRHETAEAMAAKLEQLARKGSSVRQFDLSGVTAMDTAGAWIIRRFMTRLAGPEKDEIQFVDGGQRYVELIGALPAELPAPEDESEHLPLFQRLFAPVGEVMIATWNDTVAAMYILGSAVRGAQLKLGRHSGVSPAAIAQKVEPLRKLLEARQQLSNLITYMDGKTGAEQLVERIMGDPERLTSLAAQAKPDDAGGTDAAAAGDPAKAGK